jgi:hypothetical protein
MPTQVSLLDGALASSGTLAIQTNGTTSAITISSAQVATFVNNPIMTGLTASRAVFTDASKGLTSNAITGTGNVVMSASPTLTGTISGAALTLSSDLTLSGGTANGVLYLNGSKVATSGSALTFDGTTLSNSTSGTPFSLNRTGAATALIELKQSGTVGSYLGTSGSNDMIFFNGSAAELMRINSTGLGIGTSSPASKLDIETAASTNGGATFGVNGSMVGTIGTGGFSVNGGAITDFGIRANANMVFSTGTSAPLRMTLDSSGNLGLGVTPSAWYTTANSRAIQMPATSLYSYSDSRGELLTNAYYNGTNYIYRVNYPAILYSQEANTGAHKWYTAASGTAGNAITFSQVMTLDASGNLLLGSTATPSSASMRLLVANPSGDGYAQFANNTSGGGAVGAAGGSGLIFYGYTGAVGSETYTERMRIDSSGNLLVGTTTASTTSGAGVKIGISSGNVSAVVADSTGSLDTYNYYSTNAGAFRFYVNSAGTVHATNTTISAISDQRFKENIQDLDVGLSAIMALKPRKFDWKAGKGKDIKNDRGFVAQEFEQVFPDLIDEWKDPAPEGEEPYKSVRQDLIPVLVKALQELKSELDSVKAELATLKG